MQPCIVFDLDGTLADSLPGIAEGLNRALRTLGLPVYPQEAIRGMIGRGAANLCAAALGYADTGLAPQAQLEALHNAFRQEYPHCWQGSAYTHPYPGIPALLEELAALGARMAVLSNKPHDVTLPMVQALFPGIPFEPILGHRPNVPRKPHPAALQHIAKLWGIPTERIILVGDSAIDAATAQAAGCKLITVDWGYSCGVDMHSFPAPCCSKAEELLRHIQRIK